MCQKEKSLVSKWMISQQDQLEIRSRWKIIPKVKYNVAAWAATSKSNFIIIIIYKIPHKVDFFEFYHI